MTSNRDIPIAKSIIDYIARWLGMTFIGGYRQLYAPKRPGGKGGGSEKALSEKAPVNAAASLIPGAELPQIAGGLGQMMGAAGEPGAGLDEAGAQMAAFNGQFSHFQTDAPVCDVCGSITVRNGNCYRCHNCGSSMGCS